MDKDVVHIKYIYTMEYSVQFSCSVVSYSLRHHRLQHARHPYPSLSPRVCSNSCPLSQWCQPTISSSVTPSPPALQHQNPFQWVWSLHQVAKALVLQLQHQSFQRILRLISLRIDWVDLLAVQGTLKSLLQHYSSKASVLRPSFFFLVPLLPLYMTTGKTIALTMWTFVGKVMSLYYTV